MLTLQSVFGIFAVPALAFALSENRRAVAWRQIATGLGVTVALALLFLRVPQLKAAFPVIGDAVDAIAAATRAGTSLRVRLSWWRRRCRSNSKPRARTSSSRSRRCRSCW